MASLNTLRTKFGYVLSGVIAFALLAFIFSLKNDMGFSSNDPVVGEINSEDVLYSDYYAEYQKIKEQYGATEATEQEAASLASAAWQSMIAKRFMAPGFEQVGLVMSDAERMAVINGEIPTQAFFSAFADPSTGGYNSAAVAQFLSQASTNPQIDEMWNEVNAQARSERAAAKFNALVKAGTFVNKLQVAQGVASSNNTYSGKWVSLPYSTVVDSLFTVSNSEISKYYQANKKAFEKYPTRTLRYVSFDFVPTEQDIVDLENQALQASKEFAAATDLRGYVRGNLNSTISTGYMSAAQLAGEQVSAFEDGKMYGPVNTNNVWTIARAVETIKAPDSLGIRHIVLNYTQNELADSLLTALKGGANFAEAAQTYSLYTQSAQLGGEVGVMPFSAFTGEFIPVLASAKKGDIVKITSGDMIQLMEVYRADAPKTFYQVATVEYPVEASQATVSALHTDAGMFSVAAKGDAKNFETAVSEQGLIARNAVLTQGDRMVRTINDSREIARWAYGAEVGDLSEVFKTEDGYVVAILSEIDDEEYRSLESVTPSIKSILMRDKKFAELSTKMSGSSIEAVAKAIDADVKEFEGVTFSSQYIPGLGVDPTLVGAITSGEGLTAAIKGNTGVYMFDVTAEAAAEPQTEAMERVRAQATAEDRAAQYIFPAVQQMAKVKDLRGQYF